MVQRRINMALVLIAAAAVMTLMLGGVALMLWATTGTSHWLLWAVPLAPVSIAGVALLFFFFPGAAGRMDVTASVQKQIDQDLQLFKEIL